MNIFPKRIYADDSNGWVCCPELAKRVWLRLKLKRTWYATDLEILSPNSIRLFVYDMEDTCSGGIGEQIFEQVVDSFTEEEQEMLDNYVLSIYTSAALREYERRKKETLTHKVLVIRKQLFGV